MLNPKISIILPNYNSKEYLSETLNSIIEQTYINWEVILVDDKSNQETLKIVKNYQNHKKFKIILLQRNMGTAFCRNLAIRNSDSEYLAFIDSDDKWKKDKLEKQIKFMLKNQYLFTYTNYSTFKSVNTKIFLNTINPPKEFDFKKFTKNTSICKNCYWIWKINKKYNKFNIMQNLISILFISYNSIKKYKLK